MNIQKLEQVLPAAPLKIAALKSCESMGQKVNDYIVSFRKESLNKYVDSALFASYKCENYLSTVARALAQVRPRALLVNLSVERISL